MKFNLHTKRLGGKMKARSAINRTLVAAGTSCGLSWAPWCLCLLWAAGASGRDTNLPATAAARRFAEALLTHAVDRYGPQHTPFFVQMLELDCLRIPAVQTDQGWRMRTSGEWAQAMKHWPDDPQYTMWGKWFSNVGIANTANLSTDMETLQGLRELSEATGDPRYREAAEAYLRFFFKHMVSPRTGFWGWGAHMSWNTLTDKVQGDRHELSRGPITPWDWLWTFDQKAVTSEIDGLYVYHIKDKATFAFDRHYRYWETDLPESETNGYNEYAMRYLQAWAYMHARTGDSKYREWIHRMLLSRRSKTAGRTDVFPYLWNPDLDPPVGLGWQNALSISSYLLDAYRLSPDPWLLDPALRIIRQYRGGLLANWGGETFGPDSGARALPLAYEITRDPAIREQMLNAAEAFLEAKPPPVQMAQSAGQQLFFLIDVYLATGDPKWWAAGTNYLAVTIGKFQHASGLIRGTAGLRRPDFYDASQGAGELFAAWTRLAFLEQRTVLVGWDFPASIASDSRSLNIKARVHRPDRLSGVSLSYRLGDDPNPHRIRGVVKGDQVTFPLALPSAASSPLSFWAVTDEPSVWHSATFRILVTEDSVPPQIGAPTVSASMPNDEPVLVSVPITDATGLEKVTLHYTYGDRVGFSDVKLKPPVGKVEFHIQNDPQYEGAICFAFEAVDSSPAHNTALSEWRLLPCFSRVRTNLTLAQSPVVASVADMKLALSGNGRLRLALKRTPFAPAEAPDNSPVFRKYYEIQGELWKTAVRSATLSVALATNDLVGIVPQTIHFEHWDAGWTEAASTVDWTNRSVATTRAEPGWWKLAATPRAKWSSEMHGETAAPTLADVRGDGTLEVVSAMVGAAPAAVLNAQGKLLFTLDIGERVRQTGNYTGVAVADVDGDGQKEILVGSADTHLYCFASSGERKWRTKTDGLVRGGTAVGDILGDRQMQIIVASDAGTVFALRGTGEVLWSRHLGDNSGGTPVLGQLDGGGGDEILYVTREPSQLWALTASGQTLWAVPLPGRPCDPAIGDLEGDGTDEIVVGHTSSDPADSQQGVITIVDTAGRPLRQFPVRGQHLERRGINSVALADLDGDGHREIIVECGDGGAYCFDFKGKERWCFMTRDSLNGFPAFADLDNDTKPDVVIAGNDWHVYALNGQGKLLWSHKGVWYNAFASIADIDNDGLLEVVYNSPRIPGLTCLRTEGRAPGGQPWPTMRGNLRRTGCYSWIQNP